MNIEYICLFWVDEKVKTPLNSKYLLMTGSRNDE